MDIINNQIHHIWFGSSFPPDNLHNTWDIEGFKNKLWTYKEYENLIKPHTPVPGLMEEALKKKRFNQWSDIARLEILYLYGGIYIDSDIVCYKGYNLKTLFEREVEGEHHIVLSQEKKNLISNSFICCSQYNHIILKLLKAIHKNINTISEGVVWKTTGPKMLTSFLLRNKYISGKGDLGMFNYDSAKNVTILPSYYFNLGVDIQSSVASSIFTRKDFNHLKSNKDERYILYKNHINFDSIIGFQLWLGGKQSNYDNIRKNPKALKNILNNINLYVTHLKVYVKKVKRIRNT